MLNRHQGPINEGGIVRGLTIIVECVIIRTDRIFETGVRDSFWIEEHWLVAYSVVI
jgi:hypothetical protein